MKGFVNSNASTLTELSETYFQSLASTKQLKDLSSFFNAAVACGVALAMREVLFSVCSLIHDRCIHVIVLHVILDFKLVDGVRNRKILPSNGRNGRSSDRSC